MLTVHGGATDDNGRPFILNCGSVSRSSST